MKVGYIDTSFFLSIIFEDENYEKSIDVWNSLDSIYSSLLLDIESQINLYTYFINKKNRIQHACRRYFVVLACATTAPNPAGGCYC